jgi:hypothetical protein
LIYVISFSGKKADKAFESSNRCRGRTMEFDVLMLLAGILAVLASLVIVFMCKSFSDDDTFCPARFWSRRPAWDHEQEPSPDGR